MKKIIVILLIAFLLVNCTNTTNTEIKNTDSLTRGNQDRVPDTAGLNMDTAVSGRSDSAQRH